MACKIYQIEDPNVELTFKTRNHFCCGKSVLQLETDSVAEWVLQQKMSKDTLLRMCVTYPFDLYPKGENWNFVFGEAWIHQEEKVCVQSLARYDPYFPRIKSFKKLTENEKILILHRSLGTLVHEICHVLGMDHCIYFNCLMNGSNSMDEADKTPLFLCPVCLNKLKYLFGDDLDVKLRYVRMKKFFEKYGLKNDANWIKERFGEVEKKKSAKKRKTSDGIKQNKRRKHY